MKKEKNKEKWLAEKPLRKQQKKLKQKEKKALEKAEKDQKLVQGNEEEEKKEEPPKEHKGPWLHPKELREQFKKSMEDATPIIIDCSFQDLLTQKELNSLCGQIGYCHSANKKLPIHCKMTITSYRDRVKGKLDKMGLLNWGIITHEKHYLDYYPHDKLVYLSGDAEEDIEEVDKNKIYIVGGLVDHNRIVKGTYDQAKKEGIAVKRLPISKYLTLQSSCILTVNHVFEILVRVLNNESWKDAFENTIPKRKIAEFLAEDKQKSEKSTK